MKDKLNIGQNSGWHKDYICLSYEGTKWYKRHKMANGDLNHNLASFDSIDLEDESMAKIVSFNTIEHLTDEYVLHMLKESYRMLKPNGEIEIGTVDCQMAYDMYKKTLSETDKFDTFIYRILSWYSNKFKNKLKHK